MLFLTAATRPPLGADVAVLATVIGALDRRRHDIDVWLSAGTAAEPTPMFDVVSRIPGLDLHAVDIGLSGPRGGRVGRAVVGVRTAASLARLGWTTRRRQTQVIHVADRRVDAIIGVALAKATGATSVVHVNLGFAPWMGRPLRWALRNADALVAVSEFVARTLIDGGHDARRVYTVHNAVDSGRWVPAPGDRDAVRREFGVDDDAPLVLSVCRLFEGKGPADLIRACAQLGGQFPGLRLVIAGIEGIAGGTYRATLEALIADLGVSDMVTLAGWRDDIPRLMAGADVYAMPSHLEPFGLVFAEAMSMGLPVVALDDGGTPEVVDHGATGLLSAHGDHDGLVANLTKLLGDDALRRTMGESGRQRVLERFTKGHLGDSVARVYEDVASARLGDRRGRS